MNKRCKACDYRTYYLKLMALNFRLTAPCSVAHRTFSVPCFYSMFCGTQNMLYKLVYVPQTVDYK